MYCTQKAEFPKNFQVVLIYFALFLKINSAGLEVKKPVRSLCVVFLVKGLKTTGVEECGRQTLGCH